jgi:hypothetical protein
LVISFAGNAPSGNAMTIALAPISTGCVKLFAVCDLEHHMSQLRIVEGTSEVCTP